MKYKERMEMLDKELMESSRRV